MRLRLGQLVRDLGEWSSAERELADRLALLLDQAQETITAAAVGRMLNQVIMLEEGRDLASRLFEAQHRLEQIRTAVSGTDF